MAATKVLFSMRIMLGVQSVKSVSTKNVDADLSISVKQSQLCLFKICSERFQRMRQLCCCFFFFFFFLAMCAVEPFMCLDPDTHRVKYGKPIMATTAVDFPVQNGHARGAAVVLHGGHQCPSENKIY